MSYRHTTRPLPPNLPRVGLGTALLFGFGAGLAGVAAMTLVSKLEQTLLTHRPDSYVPAYTLLALLGKRPPPEGTNELWQWNMAMHYGQGAVLGVVRAVWAFYGFRGPFADFLFMGLRLANDQTLENAMGTGALPWTWPVGEQWVDLVMKGVYAGVTGWVVDCVV